MSAERSYVTQTITLTQINCGECGGTYAINERYRQQKEDHGQSWNCPYCRIGWGYSGNGALQKAQKALAEERERHARTLALRNEAEARAASVAADLERHKKRAKNGVCPCCKRAFKQLAAHMKNKHPDYK